MKNITKRLHAKRIILVLIIILWMCVVFSLSSQNGDESNGTSSYIVNIITSLYEKNSCSELSAQNVHNLTFIVRKIAHFILYFIGSIPVLTLFKTYDISKNKTYLYTILFCFVYACSDELHQLLSEGRNGNVIDVVIDTLGGIFGMMFIQTVSNIAYKLRE